MAGLMQDGAGQAVPVVEAAARLGLAPETVRKRLWRGQMAGEKRDGQWYVVLPTDSVPDDAGLGRTGQDSGQDHAGPMQDAGQDTAAVLVPELRERVAFLERALERRDRDLASALERLHEAHVLLAQRPALPSGEIPNRPEVSTGTPHPWWAAFWPWRRATE